MTLNKTEEDLFAIDSLSAKPKSNISFLDEDDLFKDTQLPIVAAPIITKSSTPAQVKKSDNLWGDEIISKYESDNIEIQKKLAQEQEINKLKKEEDKKKKEELEKKSEQAAIQAKITWEEQLRKQKEDLEKLEILAKAEKKKTRRRT